jgi:CRISPR-associated protein Cas8a1/Csx13
MGRLNLVLSNPLFELPHRVGMQGIAKLLDYCDRTQCLAGKPIKWELFAKQIDISWDCPDIEFFTALQEVAYQLKDGEIDAPCLNLTYQERYFFNQGILNSFLQHNTHRKFTGEKQGREFMVEDNPIPITRTIRTLKDFAYSGFTSKFFGTKGNFPKTFPLKSNHFPGLIEEVGGAGIYQGTIEEFFTLYFLPLATIIYPLPMNSLGARIALCLIDSPDLLDSLDWNIPRTFIDATVTSAGDACLRILNQNLNRNIYNLDHEVFILGGQPWNSRQKFLKQSVARIHSDVNMLNLYKAFAEMLPPKYRTKTIKEKDSEIEQAFVSGSHLLGYITDNMIQQKPWHFKLGEYLLTQEYFEKETLIRMVASHTEPEYKAFQRVIQLAYLGYLANKPDNYSFYHYGKLRAKFIYLLNTPRNQQAFRKAFTQFLTSSEVITENQNDLDLVTSLIETDWQKAKDWALQAILLFVPPAKENITEETINESK